VLYSFIFAANNKIPCSGQKIRGLLKPRALIHLYNVEEYVVVIIDIFRATSSICYGMENGAEAIIPVAEVEECLAYKEKHPDYLLAAERVTARWLPGLILATRRLAILPIKVAGKTVVLTTTNGTQALYLIAQSKADNCHRLVSLTWTAVCNLPKSHKPKCFTGMRRLEIQL
jgi:2-phosphosulfolactate phosphatase